MFDKNCFVYFILSIFFLFVGVLFSVVDYPQITVICLIILNIIYLFKYKNNLPVFILFFYIFLHSKVFYFYYFGNVQLSFWTDLLLRSNLNIVLLSHLLFLSFLGITINSTFISGVPTFIKQNTIIFVATYIVCVFLLVFGITGDNIIATGSYSNDGDTHKSTLHEYFLLFFIILLYFKSYSRGQEFFIKLLFGLYAFKTIIYGGRIEVLEATLIYSIYYFFLPNKVHLSRLLFFLFTGIYFSAVLSSFRSNPSIIFTDDYYEIFVPSEIFSIPSNNSVLMSTEGDVIQSSSRIVGIANSSEFNFFSRFESFFYYIISSFVPSSYLPPLSNLSTFKQDVYRSGGGGLISTYFYVWLWYFGPCISAFCIGFFINKFYLFKSKYYFIYGISLLSTFPRWFSYNPIFLLKFCLYLVIVFWFFSRIIKRST